MRIVATSISRNNAKRFVSDIAFGCRLVWKTHRGYASLVASLTVAQGCLPALQLLISKLLIDTAAGVLSAVPQQPFGPLLTLIGMQAGILLLGVILGLAQATANAFLGELLSNQINLQVLEKTNGLEVAFFENPQFYNMLQNAYQEAGNRPLEIVTQMFRLVQSVVTLTSAAILLWWLNWAILPLLLISAVPALLIQSLYGYQNYWIHRQRAPELRKQRYFGSLLTSDWFVKEIRVYQLESFFFNSYKSLFAKFFGENQKLTIMRNVGSLLSTILSTLGWLLAASYVVMRTVARTITIGDFALYTQTISIAQGQFQAIMSGLSALYSSSLFLHNLFQFLSLPARDLCDGKRWTEPVHDIEFHKVSFQYPGTDRSVLHDVSFKICLGQSLALVGKNGTGKTTIAKLLCRLYEPTEGEILFNGKNVTEYSPRSVQEQVAVLFQDYGHYYLSAKDNIGIGRAAHLAETDAIHAAAQKSGADAVIENLPDKYETVLGRWFDGGVQLSGGEWQKIALARALMREGSLLILDEPTASLDAEAEYEVFEHLLHDTTNRIGVLISHRFSTVRLADHILVLDDGRCTESGSHEELMALGGHYAHLFALQARGYEVHAV